MFTDPSVAEPELEEQPLPRSRVEYGLVVATDGGAPVEIHWQGYARIPHGRPLTWPGPESRAGITAPVQACSDEPGWEAGVDGAARFVDGALDRAFAFPDGRRWLRPGDILAVTGLGA